MRLQKDYEPANTQAKKRYSVTQHAQAQPAQYKQDSAENYENTIAQHAQPAHKRIFATAENPRKYDTNGKKLDFSDIAIYISENNLHVITAYNVIKAMARNNSINSAPAQQIINSGYNETIFEDIQQAVFLRLFELAQANHISINKDGFIEYETINEDSGQTYYVEIFKAVSECFAQYKTQSVKRTVKQADGTTKQITIINHDCISLDDTVVNEDSPQYRIQCALQAKNTLQDIESRKDLKAFWGYVETVTKPTKTAQLVRLFNFLYLGQTQQTIANTMHTTKQNIHALLVELRTLYKEWDGKIEITHKKRALLSSQAREELQQAIRERDAQRTARAHCLLYLDKQILIERKALKALQAYKPAQPAKNPIKSETRKHAQTAQYYRITNRPHYKRHKPAQPIFTTYHEMSLLWPKIYLEIGKPELALQAFKEAKKAILATR